MIPTLSLSSCLICCVGLAFFLSGFFLTRQEVGKQSVCDVVSLSETLVEHLEQAEVEEVRHLLEGATGSDGSKGCWSQRRYQRVFLFIIDALRVDFVTKESMPFVYGLISRGEHPQTTHFFNFRADPPTTTSQRLKGLTTGSLPTFIDISSNFESSEINEDNWIDALLSRRGHTVGSHSSNCTSIFLGDDTWPPVSYTHLTLPTKA